MSEPLSGEARLHAGSNYPVAWCGTQIPTRATLRGNYAPSQSLGIVKPASGQRRRRLANSINGYAAVFNSETIIGGDFRERLAPGCFTRTLREAPDVLAIWNHDWARVLGRTTAGTLKLQQDHTGLWFNLDVDGSAPDGATALSAVGRKDVHGCSFGFRVRAEEWEDGGARLPLRTILDLDLLEITITPIPAYPTTTAHVADAARAAAHRAKAAMRARGLDV